MNTSVPNETQYDYHDPYNLTAGISIAVVIKEVSSKLKKQSSARNIRNHL